MEIAAESGLGTTLLGNLMVANRPLATPAVTAGLPPGSDRRAVSYGDSYDLRQLASPVRSARVESRSPTSFIAFRGRRPPEQWRKSSSTAKQSQRIDTQPLTSPNKASDLQVTDFIDVTELARRTGRFPQLAHL